MINKTHPHVRPLFSCHHSLQWISEYAQELLLQNCVQSNFLWVIDNNEQCFNGGIPHDQVIDILLTGSFFIRLLELPYWPVKEVRLWALSPDIRNFMSEVFKIPKEFIGLLPHPEIPKLAEKKELRHFVYAGRLSWGKNIDALLALVSYLQHTTHPDLELTLFGEKSDLPEESYGRINDNKFDIESLLQMYPWKKRPILKGNDPKWFDKIQENSHYISLSTSMYEDFAVSPSEAAQKNVPLILSQWGGHKYKKGATLLSQAFIFKSFEPQWVKLEKTKLLANQLIHGAKQTGEDFKFSEAKALAHDELSSLMMSYIQKNSPEILLCFREAMDVFADTFKGRNFFYQYQKHFGSTILPDTMIFYKDEAQSLDLEGNVIFIPHYDQNLPEVMRWKMTAKKVYGE